VDHVSASALKDQSMDEARIVIGAWSSDHAVVVCSDEHRGTGRIATSYNTNQVRELLAGG
jgi:hypothetical protein